MAKTKKVQNNFTAGEMSPVIRGRSDLAKYYNGCVQVENFIVRPEGGAFKRPGFSYTATGGDITKAIRMIPFTNSDIDSYILEFGDLYIRFYRNWGPVTDEQDVVYEIVSPYLAKDLPLVQFGQSADVMYLTHPKYQTRKLSRTGHTSWTMAAVTMLLGPFLVENDTTTTITPSAVTGNITLTASSPTFQSDGSQVGALFQITYSKDSEIVSGDLSGNGSSSTISVLLGQTIDFVSNGTWTGNLALEVSYDAGNNYETVTQIFSKDNRNVEDIHTEENGDAIYRFTMSSYSGAGTCSFNIVTRRSRVNGVVKITGYTSPSLVSATVIETLANTIPTKLWSEGSWSDYRGWPSALAFHNQRIFYGGTTHQPTTLWGSVVLPGGDYENFRAGTNDDDAVTYTVAASQDPIKYLASGGTLIAGTTGGSYIIDGSGQDAVLSPTNVRSRIQDISGTAAIMPIRSSLGLLYVERGGKRVGEFAYNWESDRHVSANMTRLAEHITGTGIKEVAFQRRPERIMWCVTNDGTLIGMTYQRAEDVVCWQRMVTDGTFESVAVKSGTSFTNNSDEDEVWCVIARTIDGPATKYIERMMPWSQTDQEDYVFVDSGITYDGDAATAMTGLEHLEGETVKICADGAVQPDKVVSGGALTLDTAASVVQIGMGYTAILKPMRDVSGLIGLGTYKRISETAILFYQTNAAMYGIDADNLDELTFRDASDPMDTAVPFFDGTKRVFVRGKWEKEGDLIIESDAPLPCNVLSLTMLLETE